MSKIDKVCDPAGGVDVSPELPEYLQKHYWWAYAHPGTLKFFDHKHIINLILWGNYNRLRDAALSEFGDALPGRTLQVACAYGDLTNHLCERVAKGSGALDLIDIVPMQLNNVRSKLPDAAHVRYLVMDAANMRLDDASYDQVVVYLLFHEQPSEYRRRTLGEIFRVLKPGGKLVIIDYARPRWWNPWRYWFGLLLRILEPFALDLWRRPLTEWMPAPWSQQSWTSSRYFGGLYQKVVVTK